MKTDKGTVIGKGKWLVIDSLQEGNAMRTAIAIALDSKERLEVELETQYAETEEKLNTLKARLDSCRELLGFYRALCSRIDLVLKNYAEENSEEEKQCDCYNPIYARCNGTKEQDECKCGGDESKCDFYDYKRRKHNV